jgi:hypothetical protein
MPDPVFDATDRVAAVDITNKTPQQVAAEYQARERQIVATAQSAIATAHAGPPPSPPRETQATYTNDSFNERPLDTTREILQREGVTRTEFDRVISASQENLIQNARFQASQGKQYWGRLSAIIDQYTATADPMAKINSSFWETAYHAALGANLSTIQAEERAAAAASASSEAPSGGATPPPAPRMLNDREMRVVEGLGITADRFRSAEGKMASGSPFPITLDNRRR